MLIQPALDKLKERGALHVGFQRYTPPFSYSVDETFDPVGYSVDLCRHVVAAIGRQCGRDEVEIVPVEVTSSNRLAFLEQGLIDMECGSTTNTVERQRYSLFSRSIFYTAHRILLKDSAADTDGRRALTITGIQDSTSHRSLMECEHPDPDQRFDFTGCPSIFSAFERFRDDPQVDAIIADEVILKSLLLRSQAAGVRFFPDGLGGEPYGFMIRMGEDAFKAAVDDQLACLFRSDGFASLYAKWFMQPLPDLGFDLSMPMSSAMREVVRSSDDQVRL
ncbi:hypothetical protein D3870_11295 [Noviherbaspirillum cavernae]|uniref:Solute-binding protein family 3/N-terminal domain-containing protein n=1 Tax=Noviherbaspirillum cavernae TaxID=2320862 RepID=A0A418X242_9BURK|nr:transporter substrate-binding domain-containing protein [Noviherbaspirillum cavernae]RJG06518.1 hypothetical protein D3870_11295 [Noviherbaspirillum cavernae]